MTSRFPDPAEPRLKATFLLATLKHKREGGEFSHTETLCELVIKQLRLHNVKSEIVRLVEYDIKPGIKSNMGKGDDWPAIQKKVLAADIIVFATPIWWGNQSSLMQRVIERLDELHTELRETGKSRLTNKVGGIVITGEEDGEQHITGNISNFMLSIGVTLPPCAPSPTSANTRGRRSSRWQENFAAKSRPRRRRRRWLATSRSSLAFSEKTTSLNPRRTAENTSRR
ncbi:MAG: flavodoxin family protein [Gemmatimonadota bacterium]|nr:flavodoxin family protein [Gemmatimonadota bacterium]